MSLPRAAAPKDSGALRSSVEDLVVVDDGSTDGTASIAKAAGARVVCGTGGPGKGQALRQAVTDNWPPSRSP